jgi:hypothetical protein
VKRICHNYTSDEDPDYEVRWSSYFNARGMLVCLWPVGTMAAGLYLRLVSCQFSEYWDTFMAFPFQPSEETIDQSW